MGSWGHRDKQKTHIPHSHGTYFSRKHCYRHHTVTSSHWKKNCVCTLPAWSRYFETWNYCLLQDQTFHSFLTQMFEGSEGLRRMTLFRNMQNLLIHAIAGSPRRDSWSHRKWSFLGYIKKESTGSCPHPSTCSLGPETSLTFLFLSWLGSSGASSPMSSGLRYNFTVSSFRCMALKTSCKSERIVDAYETHTCPQNSPIPYLILRPSWESVDSVTEDFF